MADAYINMGICPCIKHMPGHFSTLIDPHLNVIESNMTEDEIKKEISYLREFSKYPMVMTSHIKLNCVDNQNPTTLSKEVINRIIREIIGFKGFIISDAIDMHAVEGNVLEKAKKALDAGVDAICYCMGKYEEMYDICNANLFMNEKSLIRFANIKKVINNKPNTIDFDKLRMSYLDKMRGFLDKQYSYDATEVLHQMQKKGDF